MHERGTGIEEGSEPVQLAPLNGVARRLEIGVDGVVGVCLGGRQVRVAVVARDRRPCHLGRERRREQLVLGGLSGDRRADQPGGETLPAAMRILQQLNLAIQVLAHRRHPAVAFGDERGR